MGQSDYVQVGLNEEPFVYTQRIIEALKYILTHDICNIEISINTDNEGNTQFTVVSFNQNQQLESFKNSTALQLHCAAGPLFSSELWLLPRSLQPACHEGWETYFSDGFCQLSSALLVEHVFLASKIRA